MFVSQNWDDLRYGGKVDVYPTSEPSRAEFVHFQERTSDGYGNYMQGDGECYLIFRVDGKHYKKTGYQSSYGDEISWNGDVTIAEPRTIQVWE